MEAKKRARGQRKAGGKGAQSSMIYKQFSADEVNIRSRVFKVLDHSGDQGGITKQDLITTYGDLGNFKMGISFLRRPTPVKNF